MKKIISSAVALVLIASFSACGKKQNTLKEMADEAVTNVTVTQAVKRELENTVTYTGEIEASESTSVSAKVSGQATEVYKDVGDYVNAGEALVKVDDTNYRTQYEQALASYKQAVSSLDRAKASYTQAESAKKSAEAAYGQAQAGYNNAVAAYNSTVNGSSEQTKVQLSSALNSAQIAFNDAQTAYEQQKVLYENGAISKSEYDRAVTGYENAKLALETAQKNYDLTLGVLLEESKIQAQSGVESAKAAMESASTQIESAKAALKTARIGIDSANISVETAQIALKSAQTSLNDTVVHAPISGYIARRSANKGQMVAQGVEIFAIKSTSTIDAKINVTESIITYVSIGTKAIVSVKAAGVSNIEGSVTSVSPVKDSSTGLYTVCIAIENENGLLKDGMFASITLTIEDSVDALIIPAESVLEDSDGVKYVYVTNGDTAERRDIDPGIVTDEYTEVLRGIKEGDKIVVSGKEYLSEKNNKIKIIK